MQLVSFSTLLTVFMSQKLGGVAPAQGVIQTGNAKLRQNL